MLQEQSLRCLFGLATACLTVSSALAQDVEGGLRLDFGLEQSLEFGDNISFSVPAEGSTTRAATVLSFGLFSSTPLDRLEFTASGALLVENTPDTLGTEAEFARPQLGFSYTREVPDALFGIALDYEQDSIDRMTEDLADSDASGTQTDYGASLRFEARRTTPASIFVETAYDVVEYDTLDPDLVDNRTASALAGTRLQFSEVLVGVLSLRFTREEDDGALGVDETLTASFDMDRTLPNGLASLSLAQISRGGSDDQTTFMVGRSLDFPSSRLSARIGVTRSVQYGVDLVGDLSWTHELPDGEVSVSLGRSVGYDLSADETILTSGLEMGWTHEVSPVASVAFDLSWSLRDSVSERIEESEFSATYSAALTPDWQLDSGIRYRVRDDADGQAESPQLFVSLGRVFSVRP